MSATILAAQVVAEGETHFHRSTLFISLVDTRIKVSVGLSPRLHRPGRRKSDELHVWSGG